MLSSTSQTPATPQLRQQHCAETVAAPANVMPVQLDVQLDKPAAVTEAPVPVQRVQHNSTLETLGSAMLLVLVGFLVVDGAQIAAPYWSGY